MRHKIIFFILMIIISTNGYNQDLTTFNTDTLSKNGIVFHIVEQMPQFPGGDAARLKYISQNVRYPLEALERGIQGRVFTSFVVNVDGNIIDVKLLRGIGGGCDQEALRVIKNMPKWNPGIQRGKNVKVQFNMPMLFKLDGEIGSIADIDAQYSKGNTLMETGNYEKAKDMFSKSIDKKKEMYKEAYLKRGFCKYHLGNPTGAIEDINKAMELKSMFNRDELALLYFEIGNEYFDKKDYQKALEYYSESALLTPDDGNVYFNLGIVNFYLGNKDQACNDLLKAKELGKEEAGKIIEERCK